MHTFADRDLRQRDLIPPDRLASCHATVVGVGAVGRQVALQLAALGVPRLQLIDFDTVEPVNLAPQAWLEEDVGRPKVEAAADLCRRLNSGVLVDTLAERFRRSTPVADVLFAAVDSIDARRLIFESVRDRVGLYVDGRMAAEALRVLAVHDGASGAHYESTLFPAAEAHPGSCTARSTVYGAFITSALMVGQFAKWLRRHPLEADIALNLLAAEWSVLSPAPQAAAASR